MREYLNRMRGGAALPARLPMRKVARAVIGALIAIGIVAFAAESTARPLVLGSFGASCVLLFGFPDNPFSQPRNAIGGHFLASLMGLIFLFLLGPTWLSMALAVASAVLLMHLTRTIHPPAGSNPVIVMLSMPSWHFLITPTLIGAVTLVAVAVVFNNLFEGDAYPRYWL
jgi:CBS-domain-containing membrane protein